MLIFNVHCNTNTGRLTEEHKRLEPVKFADVDLKNPPWKCNERKVMEFEASLVNALSSTRPISPFMSQNEKGKRKRRYEAFPGISDLRHDRDMAGYVRMLRSGLCELAIMQTVESLPHARVTLALLRAMRECLADSFDSRALTGLRRRLRRAMTAFMTTYQAAVATITMHMIIHMVDAIERCD